MAKIGMTRRSKKQQRIAAGLGEIIDEMVQAMWSANPEYIARSNSSLTPSMNDTLCKFQDYCMRYYGKKT